ncbi:hypothetical protein F5Y19DRAFT_492823 [Xylariaceae sp. FL1651]|nr:hypothetical protein F5Y19DRAFT_492823 [Xylariaceae sp. FL1651]
MMHHTLSKRRATRSSTPRMRLGCRTCRCTKEGWKCDGYEQADLQVEAAGNVTGDAIAARGISTEPGLSIASCSIPFRVPDTQKDRRMLHYYYVQGSHYTSGYLHSDFWSDTVLRESHHEPVVRQALVSLSTLHLSYITTDAPRDGDRRVEVPVYHGKAIRALKKRLETPTRATI